MKTEHATKEAKAHRYSGSACVVTATLVTVLHIDDDPNDAALLRAAALQAENPFRLETVEDAEQAMAYLDGVGPYADRQRYAAPALILLDLKMPRTNGLEVLHWIRAHPRLAAIPVVILSGSELQEDIQSAYAGGANSYLVKPLGFDALVALVNSLSDIWLKRVSAASASLPAIAD